MIDAQTTRLRVMVVEDHQMVADALKVWLTQLPDVDVVGSESCLKNVLFAAEHSRPDLIILDWFLDGISSAETVRSLVESEAKPRVLVISAMRDVVIVDQALRAGAHGFVAKMGGLNKLMQAVEAVMRGEIFLDSDLANSLIRQKYDPSRRVDGPESLTGRELQVYSAIGSGKKTGEIAQALGISVKTVEAHRENIKNKLGYSSSSELARAAALWMAKNILPT